MARKAPSSGRGKQKHPEGVVEAGDVIDQQLARYRSMRDFSVTAEPSGSPDSSAKLELPFVIQKHSATRLHYDFRLGWNGVLKSWAVAKGPSYDTHDKRLAVQVEDHPMEYGGFEGTIPKGQYGGGTVMLWDEGTWQPLNDVDEGLRTGSLKFELHGTKLQGNWTLVRMGGKAANESKPNWLLIKEHDGLERSSDAACITETDFLSVVTGRSLEEIAADGTHVWNSKETAGGKKPWHREQNKTQPEKTGPARGNRQPASSGKTSEPGALSKHTAAILGDLPREAMPGFLKPQLAEEAKSPPTGKQWVHEIKLDGYRVQAHKHGRTVVLYTRSGLDWTHRMKPVAAALVGVSAETAVLDGEVTVLDASGLSSFARLQASFEKNEKHPLTFFGFDLLHLDGRNTRDLPLAERKQLLREVLGEDTDEVRLSEDLPGDGAQIFDAACKLHAEGIISKRDDQPYAAGRSTAWMKSKCLFEQEFVIGGFTDLSNGARGVGSLLLGYYNDAGKLIYAGRTGTGFTQKTHNVLRDHLEPLLQKPCPFQTVNADGRRGAHWVKPKLVAQVRFASWTAEQQVRQAAYLGLREDKPAKEVRREQGPPTAKHKPAKSQAAAEETRPTGPRSPAPRSKPAPSDALPPIRLTHPDKIVDTISGVTKRQLAEYLWAVSAEMLPHIGGRPLSLVRCPDGSGKPCFYQKHVNQMLPAGIASVMVSDKRGGTPEPYVTLNSREALTSLAQLTVLEIHPWGSTNKHLEQPDRLVFDLDPDDSLPWSAVVEGAFAIRSLLTSLHLKSFVKTTGGKGLHVAVPIEPEHDFAAIKAWTHSLVQSIERKEPQHYLTVMTKAARKGKIYLDYLRNERGATAVAPYSMRARAGLPVSVPLSWSELERLHERPDYRVANFAEWSAKLKENPWRALLTTSQQLPAATLQHFSTKKART